MRVHGKATELGRKQRHDLKSLFSQLDSDNSGVVSIEELYEPLLSLGLVQSKQEVEQLVHYASAQQAGVLKFEEFAKLFDCPSQTSSAQHGRLDKLIISVAGKMRNLTKSDLPLCISVGNQRRALMMQAYISENLVERDKGLKVITKFANEIHSQNSPSKNERLNNRHKSEFNDKRTERSSKCSSLPRNIGKNEDFYMDYHPPVSLKTNRMTKDSRVRFLKYLNNI
ncbi:hypothetical protein SteCoe_6763 [Stentor coeruleus]|uniref:EF-hand domain-containing protein n=1 Tax=Stentor coeruleus TaxID=5963 RepID=A0A1R2CP61_9CILI|nr:hypothetical protein SteCoe_6763 [Stentor coeruleus]